MSFLRRMSLPQQLSFPRRPQNPFCGTPLEQFALFVKGRRESIFLVRSFIIPRVLLAVFILFFLSTPDAHSRNLDAEKGGILVAASIGEPSNLIPILATDSASQSIVSKVFNGLLKYNPNLELEGDLAENWEVFSGGKTIIFYLRRGVLWHDGTSFTSADVEFTYQKLIDPDMPSPYRGDFLKVTKFEVLDPYAVKISYSEPFSPALSSWTMPIMPKHVLKDENFLETEFARRPIGTGPYKFKRWVTGEKVELVVFEDYFEGRANIDLIINRVIPDQTTSFLELHQKTVDFMSLTPLQYSKQSSSDYFERNYRKFRYPSLGYTYLGFNLQNEIFADKRVRLAINYAINKQEIIDGVLLGLGRICTGPFTPESWAYNKDIKIQSYNPKKAKVLLRQAGFVENENDKFLYKDGKKFEFTIITNQGNDLRRQSAEIIQRRLKEVGIEVKIKIMEWSSFLKEVVNKKKFEAVLLGWGLSLDPDPFDIWHSSKTGPGEFNFISYSDRYVDFLIEKGRTSFDIATREAAYHEIHSILYEDQPYVFLYVADSLPIINQRFKNVEATPLGLGYNFIDWEVPQNERRYTKYSL